MKKLLASSYLLVVACTAYCLARPDLPYDSIPKHSGLGVYNGLVNRSILGQTLWPKAIPGSNTQLAIKNVLDFSPANETPVKVIVERKWEADSIAMEEISWSVGYGPRTRAWVLKPQGISTKLPAILALHDHGGYKFFGKEKIADAFGDVPDALIGHRKNYYGGIAMANYLAKKGFLVLIHDVFLWGSRKFPLEDIPEQIVKEGIALNKALGYGTGAIEEYNTISTDHEDLIEKYCRMLDINLAGIVAYEDRVATQYLTSRNDVDTSRIGCIGFSGGGTRSAFLFATCPQVKAAAIVSMMSTYQGMLDAGHNGTWLCFPPGLSRVADYADVAACRAPLPLLVQYNLGDVLFTKGGMESAHERIQSHYTALGKAKAYQGQFYEGPHKFDQSMQKAACEWFQNLFSIK